MPINKLPASPIKTFAGDQLNFRKIKSKDNNTKAGIINSNLLLIYKTTIIKRHCMHDTDVKCPSAPSKKLYAFNIHIANKISIITNIKLSVK